MALRAACVLRTVAAFHDTVDRLVALATFEVLNAADRRGMVDWYERHNEHKSFDTEYWEARRRPAEAELVEAEALLRALTKTPDSEVHDRSGYPISAGKMWGIDDVGRYTPDLLESFLAMRAADNAGTPLDRAADSELAGRLAWGALRVANAALDEFASHPTPGLHLNSILDIDAEENRDRLVDAGVPEEWFALRQSLDDAAEAARAENKERSKRSIEASRRRWQQTRLSELATTTPLPLGAPARLGVSGVVRTVSLDYDGRLIVAAEPSDADDGDREFSRDAGPSSRRVEVVSIGAGERTSSFVDVPFARPMFQPLPGGQLLAVAARTRCVDGVGEHNGLVLRDGRVTASFTLGDGIQSVNTTRDGQIWVGYFDEGVFGSNGWGGRGQPVPIGNHGLICWSSEGEQLWHYQAPSGLQPISDCYALNVTDDAAWICYYADFSICRINRNRTVTSWPPLVGGAKAIAASENRVALIGGYYLYDRLLLCELGNDAITASHAFQLTLPDGGELPRTAQLLARGQHVHAISGDDWYQLRIDDLDIPT